MEPLRTIVQATRNHVSSALPHAPTVPASPPRSRRATVVIRGVAAAMSDFVERYRARRAAARRRDAIERAIAKNPSLSLRQELETPERRLNPASTSSSPAHCGAAGTAVHGGDGERAGARHGIASRRRAYRRRPFAGGAGRHGSID